MRCEDDESNLCRRVLRQMLEQNRERLTECQECKDGVWLGWEDTGPCMSLCYPFGAHTGPYTGFKGQKMRCKRNLGGKYCKEAGEEVEEDHLLGTTMCQTDQCQPVASAIRAKRLMILAPKKVFQGDQIELICQANSNLSGG